MVMSTAARKKRFIRQGVPMGERVASLAILALLAAIGVAIGVKGRHYDPRRYSLDASALTATRSTTGLAAGDQSAWLRGVGPGGAENPGVKAVAATAAKLEEQASAQPSGQAVAAAAPVGHPLTLPVDGLEPMGPTEDYTPDNLYEKIDGQAEGYINFSFAHMRCRSFSIKGGGGAYVDAYVYDMSAPISAYGIFSAERDASAPLVDFASDGYRSAMGFFLRQGKDYVQVLASDAKPETMAFAEKAARALAASIHADDSGLEGLRKLPAGCDPATISYNPTDAFGIPGLNAAYQADYTVNGRTMTFFIATLPDAKAAAKAFDDFKKYAGQFGKVTEVEVKAATRRFDAESFGQWRAIYHRGSEVGGVAVADDRAAADKLVADFLAGTFKLPPFKAAPKKPAKPAGAASKPGGSTPSAESGGENENP
jgi:hypothetical protein